MVAWRVWMSLVLGLGVAGCSGEAKQPKSDAALAAEARKSAGEAGPRWRYLVWSMRADGARVTTLVSPRGDVVGRKFGVAVHGRGEGLQVVRAIELLLPCERDCAEVREGCPNGDWEVNGLGMWTLFPRASRQGHPRHGILARFVPPVAPKKPSPNESYEDKMKILSVTRDHIFVRWTSEHYICGADGASRFERVYAVGLDGKESSFVAGVGAEVVAAHEDAIVRAAQAKHKGFLMADARLKLVDAWPVWGGAQPTWMYGFDGTCGERCSGMVGQEQPLRVEVPAASPPPRAVRGEDTPAAVAAIWAAEGAALGWADGASMSDEERAQLDRYFK